MPATIPDHLAGRPLWHGMVVPWVAAWTSERRYKLKPDARISRTVRTPHLAVFTYGRPEVGEPELGLMHIPRQRDCVLEKLCQVCGRGIEGNPIAFTWNNQLGFLEGDMRMLCLEPWVCRPCAEYAMRICPAVSSADRHHYLEVYEVIRAQPVAATIDPEPFWTDLTPAERRAAGDVAIISFVKYALMEFETITL